MAVQLVGRPHECMPGGGGVILADWQTALGRNSSAYTAGLADSFEFSISRLGHCHPSFGR